MNASENQQLPAELAGTLQQLDELVDGFELHADENVREHALLLLQCVDHIHRTGLRSLFQVLRSAGLDQAAVQHPEIRLLFELYDLQSGQERARAEAVLAELQSSLAAEGGRLEVLDAQAGVVRVRLTGASPQLSEDVEQILRESLPDFKRLELEGLNPRQLEPQGFVPLSSLKQIGS